MADSKEKLFSDFPPVSTQEWMDKITVDLKGADFEKKLVWKTNEGFKVKPFYRQEDLEGLKTTEGLPGQFPYIRGNRKDDNTWFIRQNIRVESAEEANAKALDILNKGVDSLGFSIRKKDLSPEFIRTLLKDICCECVELNFSTCQGHTVQLAEMLTDYFREKGYDPTKLQGSVNYDPMEKMMQKGKDLSKFIDNARRLVEIFAPYPKFRCLAVNSLLLNNAGAYIYQELGYALAWGNEYLSQLTEAGVPAALAAKKIKFNFGISSNYFMEIAKFRAARMLWANIVKEYKPVCPRTDCQNTGADGTCYCACKMAAHAETSSFNLTIFDAHVNLLRTQTEAMSASLAGVDSITVTPFDAQFKNPDEFSERIARNQQLLLKEESHLDKITDPAGGSYYVETLTASIADVAWKNFLAIEDLGGFYAAIKEGKIQEELQETSKKRHQDVARRKESLLGTNQFPNFTELAGNKIEKTDGCNCGCKHDAQEGAVASIPTARAASDFEALRLATEKSSVRPKVFMLTIGNLAMRLARAQFSSNFFACAGYEIIDNLGFKTVQEGIDAAMEKNADIVVLCSSDDEYTEYAPEAFKLLDGRAEFVVAGNPACTEDLKAQGIKYFVHVRSNVLETLQEFNAKLLK